MTVFYWGITNTYLRASWSILNYFPILLSQVGWWYYYDVTDESKRNQKKTSSFLPVCFVFNIFSDLIIQWSWLCEPTVLWCQSSRHYITIILFFFINFKNRYVHMFKSISNITMMYRSAKLCKFPSINIRFFSIKNLYHCQNTDILNLKQFKSKWINKQ